MPAAPSPGTARALDALRELLAAGSRPCAEVTSALGRLDVAPSARASALRRLGVEVVPGADGARCYRLPEDRGLDRVTLGSMRLA